MKPHGGHLEPRLWSKTGWYWQKTISFPRMQDALSVSQALVVSSIHSCMVSKFSNLFLAFVALAIPPSQLGACLARGEDIPPQPSISSPSFVDIVPRRVGPFNPDWAGAQCGGSKTDRFISIAATVIIPPIILTRGDPRNVGVRIAISLGDPGMTMTMVGVDITLEEDIVTYRPIYGWELNPVQRFPNVYSPIVPGDHIRLTVFSGDHGGLVLMENLTRHWVLLHDAQVLVASPTTAQWMIQDYKKGGKYITFANFYLVLFSGAVAAKVPLQGPTAGCIPFDARATNIQQNSHNFTKIIQDHKSLSVQYLRNW